jgi:hypothetical protein
MLNNGDRSARRVHALVAAALDDPTLLAQWRGNRPAVRRDGAAALDLEGLRRFSGLATKVRQNDVRGNLPLTFELMDALKISIEVFASYAERSLALRAAGKKSKAEKILALSEFLDGWLDPGNPDHALVRDMFRHERTLFELSERGASAPAAPGPATGAGKLSVRSVPLRCESVTNHEMSCNPRELGRVIRSRKCDLASVARRQLFYVYRWDGRNDCISVAEIDGLGFVLVDLADGTHSLADMAAVLRRSGVALKAEDLRGTVQDMIHIGILTLRRRSRRRWRVNTGV